MAERYPASRILAVSNSASQRQFIQGRAVALGLTNLTVVTADMNVFQTMQTFDRVVSVEMFEHMRNHYDKSPAGQWRRRHFADADYLDREHTLS